MKRMSFRIIAVSLFSLFSCTDSSFEQSNRRPQSSQIPSAPSTSISEEISRVSSTKNFVAFGAGGSLEVRSFQITIGPSQRNSGSIVLPSDYVLIGGGASISCPPSPCGGLNLFPSSFLTASRPDFANNAWFAASKDHVNPEAHYLKIYAIGVKICFGNVSSTELRNYIQVFSSTSGVRNHPTTSVTVPSDFDMLGGGAQINYGNGAGNLLVSSYPSSSNTWTVQGKDHLFASPASITAYAIGIKKIVDFAYCPVCTPKGLFNVSIVASPSSFVSSGRAVNSIGLPSSSEPYFPWFASCPGTRTTYGGWGRMLQTSIIDDEFIRSFGSAKDLNRADSGFLTSYLIAIQPTACWCC